MTTDWDPPFPDLLGKVFLADGLGMDLLPRLREGLTPISTDYTDSFCVGRGIPSYTFGPNVFYLDTLGLDLVWLWVKGESPGFCRGSFCALFLL